MDIVNNDILKFFNKSKKDKFKKEREETFNKLKNIIGITDNNNKILYFDIDNDIIKNQIKNLYEDFFKFYTITTSSFYQSIKKNIEVNPLLAIRPIFKQHDFEIISKDVIATRNDIKKRYIQWIFNKI